MKKTIIFLSMLFISSIMNAQTVKIGKQIWMTNNLDVVTFRNGDTIPQLKTEEEWEKASKLELPAWCYYNYDPVNGTKYGKLYNWFAVNDSRGLAPKGYQVPTESEWAKMIDFLGGKDVAGKKMKSTNGWLNNGNGTNESGFNGLPGGYAADMDNDVMLGTIGSWWSATELVLKKKVTNSAYRYGLSNDDGTVWRVDMDKGGLNSVRCVKD